MKKPESSYEPHLTIREISLPPSGEWTPRMSGWAVIQVREGAGYYLQASFNRELEQGTMLMIANGGLGSIRASQLGVMTLDAFNVIPARLTGLVALGEERLFETAAVNKEFAIHIFSQQDPLAMRMTGLCAERERGGLLFRLKLLELFVELFGNELGQSAPAGKLSDARERLHEFLEQTPSSELLEMNFNELAQMTHCTTRHLSRIFFELAGMSFRDKRSELRLTRARELLSTTNSKVVDVALESGYKSLSLFNLMFVRRFGVSPARWRKQNARQKENQNGVGKKARRPVPTEIAAAVF